MTISKRKGCNIVAEMKKSRMDVLPEIRNTRHCELCIDENLAYYRCNTCRKVICDFCYSFHKKVYSMMGHLITDLHETV